MKRLLLIVLPLLLIVGCSKPINHDSLIDRNGVKYQQDSQKPYSGKTFSLWDNGQKKFEGSYKNGELNGLETKWYKNGQKKFEGTYKNGKQVGKWTTWYSIGQKWSEVTYKNGKEDGLWTTWYDNGQKFFEGTYKDGELISEKEWNEDGSVKE